MWVPRKAAGPIAALRAEQDMGLIYRAIGRKGLEGIENVGPRIAAVVEELIQSLPSRLLTVFLTR